MSKSKSRKVGATVDGEAPIHTHLAKVAAAKAARMIKNAPRAIIAMLYQIADNGLKSGRASGNVYMRNGRVRKMVVPSLVQNGYTTPVRSLLSQLSSAWNALTQAERDSWINSSSFFRSNRFGTSFSLKGKQLYVALNANLVNTGVAPVNECPLPADVPGITELTITADDSANTLSLAFTPDPTDANVNHLVYATAPLSAGVNRPSSSAFRLIQLIGTAEVSPVNASASYIAKFGAFPTGSKIFVKLIPVNATTGQAGAAIVADTIVVP